MREHLDVLGTFLTRTFSLFQQSSPSVQLDCWRSSLFDEFKIASIDASATSGLACHDRPALETTKKNRILRRPFELGRYWNPQQPQVQSTRSSLAKPMGTRCSQRTDRIAQRIIVEVCNTARAANGCSLSAKVVHLCVFGGDLDIWKVRLMETLTRTGPYQNEPYGRLAGKHLPPPQSAAPIIVAWLLAAAGPAVRALLHFQCHGLD